ncbi:hypothetical protein [Solwaraspora sp. WMMD792]|uniref:hypothetical protein n=1 Tax=Solwaraspora sp. WMMD792 TaxID=3016099 RepID=UPI0024169203|nr:hypothetical protein [Solwaraspora sp. WMMD792]MDG4770757.1 hypothetical protein [Solwaraspora sp. WMMD792]
MSHPYRTAADHSGFSPSRRSRRRPVWLWVTAPVVLAVLVIGIGALTRGEQSQATPTPTVDESTSQTPPADTEGWQACQDLREISAAELDHDVNREIGRQAQASTDATLAARGKDLVDAARAAADQEPIEGNLTISAAQVDLREACDRAFGPA